MKIHKYSIIITVPTVILSLLFAAVSNGHGNSTAQFWCSVLLGVFGSAFLTLISAIIGYVCERKRILLEYLDCIQDIGGQISKYKIRIDGDGSRAGTNYYILCEILTNQKRKLGHIYQQFTPLPLLKNESKLRQFLYSPYKYLIALNKEIALPLVKLECYINMNPVHSGIIEKEFEKINKYIVETNERKIDGTKVITSRVIMQDSLERFHNELISENPIIYQYIADSFLPYSQQLTPRIPSKFVACAI